MKLCGKITAAVSLFIMALSVAASAETVVHSSVKIFFKQADIPTAVEEKLVFNLYDEAGDVLLDSEEHYVKRGKDGFELEFNTGEYATGTKFTLKMQEGSGNLTFCDVNAKEHVIQTYCMPDENGVMQYTTSFEMVYNPAWNKEAVIKIPGVKQTLFYHCLTDDEVYVTTDLLNVLGITCTTDFEAEKPGFTLSSGDGAYRAQFYLNDIYATFGGVGENLVSPAFEINSLPYVPLSRVATYFACNYNFVAEDEYYREICLTPSVYSNEYKQAAYVNGIDIESRTDYLVWVSKKDFRVNVYLGENRCWRLIESFPCAIGAPATPTIEGSFEYYQYQDRWQYDGYYCGPIMRFKNGYALHSVLLKNNGTFYDSRVGVKISHGCVRMLPDDIKWMVSYVPMYSRILVTE